MMVWKLNRSHCIMFLSEFMLICARHGEVQFNIKKAFNFVALKFAGLPDHHVLTDYERILSRLLRYIDI